MQYNENEYEEDGEVKQQEDEDLENESSVEEVEEVAEDSDESPVSSESLGDNSQEEVRETRDRKENRVPAKTRINQIQRKRYRAENEANQLRSQLMDAQKQIDNLKHVSEQSNQAAMYSYDKSIQSQIDKAIYLKSQAIENGDVLSQVEADKELARAIAQQVNIDAWKAQQSEKENKPQERYREESKRYSDDYQDEAAEQEMAPELSDWVSENTWFNEDDEDFDPDLHEKALNYAGHLDRRYSKTGNAHKILSQDYFDEINRYMSKHINSQHQTQHTNRRSEIVMNKARNSVSPVGRSHTPTSARNQSPRLSREEQEQARLLGWDDATWSKYKRQAEIQGIGQNMFERKR